jgi:hypothetical protein
MDIVVAIPMANRKTLPAVNHEKQWIDGTLDYITDAGVPGGVITNLIAPEFPHSLRGLLARKSVSLWRSKIAVSPILDVVGLEWLQFDDAMPDMLLVHLAGEGTSHPIKSVFTRTHLRETKDLIGNIFSEPVDFHDTVSKGVAVVAENSFNFEHQTILANDHVLVFDATNDAKFVHGRCAHVLTVVAAQAFALEVLNAEWPIDSSSSKMKKFVKKYLRYRHRYEWLEIFVEPDSKMVYSNLRSMLSIEPKFRNFGIEVNEFQQNRQAKSAENLNVIGLGIAGLALIATLIDQSVSRVIAVGVLALMVIGAIVSRGRK